MKRTKIEDIQEYIVSTEKVAHVTFYLVKDKNDPFEESYLVYSESEKHGLDLVSEKDQYLLLDPVSYGEAVEIFQHAIHSLENTLQAKRDGMPTEKQVYYLFRHKIPISLDLTWGEASDIIDEHINQEKQARIQKQAERFNGFFVGQRVTHRFIHPERVESGIVTKLTGNDRTAKYVYIKYDNGITSKWDLRHTPKNAETPTVS